MFDFALTSDDLSDALELLRHAIIGRDDLVEYVGNLALDAGAVHGHPHRKVATAHRLQGDKKLREKRSRPVQSFLDAVGVGQADRTVRLLIKIGRIWLHWAPLRRSRRTSGNH